MLDIEHILKDLFAVGVIEQPDFVFGNVFWVVLEVDE